MDLREYMSVRRAYNIVRQDQTPDDRLTFEEFAILCRLLIANEPMKTSAIADYQGALRPTMTHRTNHLARLGLIDRVEGERDRRNVVCSISELGARRVRELSELTCSCIPSGRSLGRTSPERICRYVDAMGSFFCQAGDIVLLGLKAAGGGPLTVMQLVDALGLLQPTVSMSVAALAEAGYVTRARGVSSLRTTSVSLTARGAQAATELEESIEEIVVRRKLRSSRA